MTEFDQQRRLDACAQLLSRSLTEHWIDSIGTGNEKWCLCINTTSKRSWTDIGSSAEPTPKPELHQRKVMLSIWWDLCGPIYWEVLPRGITVTAQLYCEQLQRLAEKIRCLWPQLSKVCFLHDKARPHIANVTHQMLLQLGWEILPHPLYSPDIAPSDYHLFRSLQNFLSRKLFQNDNEVETALIVASKSEDFYKAGIRKTAGMVAQDTRKYWPIH